MLNPAASFSFNKRYTTRNLKFKNLDFSFNTPVLGIPFPQNVHEDFRGQQQQKSKDMNPKIDAKALEQGMITAAQTWPLRTARRFRRSVSIETLSVMRIAAATTSPWVDESQTRDRSSCLTPWRNAHGPLSKTMKRTLSLSVPWCIIKHHHSTNQGLAIIMHECPDMINSRKQILSLSCVNRFRFIWSTDLKQIHAEFIHCRVSGNGNSESIHQ